MWNLCGEMRDDPIHMLSYLSIAHIKIGLIGSETPNIRLIVVK